MLAKLWTAFKVSFLVPSRVVPFVMTASYALIGVGASWVAVHFPGLPTFTSAEVWSLFGAALLGGIAHALHWQKGWQQYEQDTRSVPPPQ